MACDNEMIGLLVTSLNIYFRRYTFYKAETFIFSRVSRIKASCEILDRYGASIRSYGRLNFVTKLPCVTLSG